MEETQPLWVILPLKGLHITDDTPPTDIFKRPWSVVGHAQMNALEDMGLGASLTSNLRKMRERAWPTALFLYRYMYPVRQISWAADRAEFLLSALATAVLLKKWEASAEDAIGNPRPVFRARYREYYDEPVATGTQGVKQVGGGRSVFPLLRPDWISPNRRLSSQALLDHIASCPSVITKVLSEQRLDRREKRLADGMAAINAAFQTLSAGAFVAALVSAAEMLVDSQSEGADRGSSTSWDRRVRRLVTVVGIDHRSVVEHVLGARHRYVHGARQPADQTLPFAALAIAVQTWTVMEQLFRIHPSVQDVETLLDCCSLARSVMSERLAALRRLPDELPPGAAADLSWISHWLQRAGGSAAE